RNVLQEEAHVSHRGELSSTMPLSALLGYHAVTSRSSSANTPARGSSTFRNLHFRVLCWSCHANTATAIARPPSAVDSVNSDAAPIAIPAGSAQRRSRSESAASPNAKQALIAR